MVNFIPVCELSNRNLKSYRDIIEVRLIDTLMCETIRKQYQIYLKDIKKEIAKRQQTKLDV